MEQHYGMTAEMYRAVTALVDDRMKGIRVVRQDFDRLVPAQARTEERLEELAAAPGRATCSTTLVGTSPLWCGRPALPPTLAGANSSC